MSLALAIYLAAHQRISYGEILTFSVLFLSVMAPLNEIHRSLDEGHECSLQVADLGDLKNAAADANKGQVRLLRPLSTHGHQLDQRA